MTAPGVTSRRILFCTIGNLPQVVTEAVWALKNQRRWVPDEIHIVTTTMALSRIHQTLQHPRGRLAGLLAGAPHVTIYVPRRRGTPAVYPPMTAADGSEVALPLPVDDDALADVNSEADAAVMGDLILQLMVGFVRDDGTEVHVSLAGGRKTMSAHALLAMTLVARWRDQASHVLVSPEFEGHPDFWHPDQGGLLDVKSPPWAAADAEARKLDPKQARITLVRTQTPLLRYEVKNIAALENLRLVDMVSHVNLAATLDASPGIRLSTATNVVKVGGAQMELGAKLFALFRLIAAARKEGWPGVGPDGTGDVHRGWLSVPHICFGRTSGGKRIDQVFLAYLTEAVRVSPTDNDPQDNKSINKWKGVLDIRTDGRKRDCATAAFNPNLTNLRKALRKGFGAAAANMLLAPSREHGDLSPIPGEPPHSEDAPRFGLDITPEAIEIV